MLTSRIAPRLGASPHPRPLPEGEGGDSGVDRLRLLQRERGLGASLRGEEFLKAGFGAEWADYGEAEGGGAPELGGYALEGFG